MLKSHIPQTTNNGIVAALIQSLCLNLTPNLTNAQQIERLTKKTYRRKAEDTVGKAEESEGVHLQDLGRWEDNRAY